MIEDGILTRKPFKPVAIHRIGDPLIVAQGTPYRSDDGPWMKTEIIEWARENTNGRWRTQENSRRVIVNPSPAVLKLMLANGITVVNTIPMIEYWIEIAFAEERDAILFKTFWL